jgi:hypothetical protein
MRLIRLGLVMLLTVLPLVAGENPVPDCLRAGGGGGDQAPFFLCLNVRREGCEELLRKIQAECGQESAKYKVAFDRYLALRTRANLLIDTVVSDLRQGRRARGDAYTRTMQEVSDAVQEFESTDKGLTCEGNPTRILEVLAPLITSALAEKIQEWVKAWISGKKEAREARAAELATQRWKGPSELEVPFPGRPAAPPAT